MDKEQRNFDNSNRYFNNNNSNSNTRRNCGSRQDNLRKVLKVGYCDVNTLVDILND